VLALAVTACALLALKVAVFVKVPQLESVVPLLTWTEVLAPGRRVPKLQVSVCDPTVPVIEHMPGPAYDGLIDQESPGPAGSGSLKVAPVAIPAGGAELLPAVMVKPMGVPGRTLAASAVLLTVRCACGANPPGGGCDTVPVAVGVGVAVWVGVRVGVAVGVGVFVAVPVGTGVAVGVAVAVAVIVAVPVLVAVAVGVSVGMGVSVGVAGGGGDALGA
jgi:hypothetical protein